eukprot:2497093-Prymnesium_polylepis.1
MESAMLIASMLLLACSRTNGSSFADCMVIRLQNDLCDKFSLRTLSRSVFASSCEYESYSYPMSTMLSRFMKAS